MKLVAIICEFNPLHTGHKRLIDYAKTLADKVVCIMSGNFTQRGMPACANKFLRAKHAVLAGADMVVELPTIFATSSAENFAFGGVRLVKALGADCLLFGSECGDISMLENCLNILEQEETQQNIKKQMQKGITYPKAVSMATKLSVFDKPNNVLALEYLRALHKLNCSATAITLQRDDNYNENTAQQFASSNLLRTNAELRAQYTFDYVMSEIDDEIESNYCQFATSFLSVASPAYLEQIEGVSEGLHNRICRADKTHGFENLMEQIKTKRYTRLKIQRIILNSILGITKQTVKNSKENFPETRVLAVNSESVSLLSLLQEGTNEITMRADKFYATLTNNNLQPTKKLLIV